MQFWKAALALGTFAVAVPSVPKRKNGLLLQSIRHSSGANSTAHEHTAQQPSGFFARDFEKMDELPETPEAPQVRSTGFSSLLLPGPAPAPFPGSSTASAPSPVTQPVTFLRGDASDSAQTEPQLATSSPDPVNLLRRDASPCGLRQCEKQPLLSSRGCQKKGNAACPRNLKPLKALKKGCHPKCSWKCEESPCNTKCKPNCAAPKCQTACEKVKLGECQRTCEDPKCAVVCPPACEHDKCAKCQTVCGEPICKLDCGNRRCESRCADPECTWDCQADPACSKPTCSLQCDQTICTIGKESKLPSAFEAPYLGQEIGWTGFAKVPVDHLQKLASNPMRSAVPPPFAKMMGGPQPLPPGGFNSISSNTGITMPANINVGSVMMGGAQPLGTVTNAPVMDERLLFGGVRSRWPGWNSMSSGIPSPLHADSTISNVMNSNTLNGVIMNR